MPGGPPPLFLEPLPFPPPRGRQVLQELLPLFLGALC